MHMRLNKSKLRTCGVDTRTLLNLAQSCMSVVTGDSFLCRARQLEILVRATVGNSSGFSAELIRNCCLTTTPRGRAATKLINNDVIVHHDVSLQTSSYGSSADITQHNYKL